MNIEIRECVYTFGWLVRPLTAVLVARFDQPRTRDQARSEVESLADGTACVALANQVAERGWSPAPVSFSDPAPSREWTVYIEAPDVASADYWLARVSDRTGFAVREEAR